MFSFSFFFAISFFSVTVTAPVAVDSFSKFTVLGEEGAEVVLPEGEGGVEVEGVELEKMAMTLFSVEIEGAAGEFVAAL